MPGYPGDAEAFTNVTVAGNTVINTGNLSIGVASCQGCVIEDNLVIQGQSDFNSVGIQAHENGTRESVDQPMTAIQVINNTIYFNETAQYTTGIRVGTEGTGHVVASNVILSAATTSLGCFQYDLAPSAY